MQTSYLEHHFERIGARLCFHDARAPRSQQGLVSLDVRSDARGEFFDIRRMPEAAAEVEILDVQPRDRHLLVMVREQRAKHKYLCGHDERHWFVAAIPESAPVGTVRQAKAALRPRAVRQAEASLGLNARARDRRKNAACKRQGEWFFLPMPQLVVDPKRVIQHEPLSRGRGSKPHWAEFCYRVGGERVFVNSRYPSGLTETSYKQLIHRQPAAAHWGWRVMVRNAGVFVRGRISHADHKTIMLHEWHQVWMNTENESAAMRNVAFLD
jgi:hypothetical protein